MRLLQLGLLVTIGAGLMGCGSQGVNNEGKGNVVLNPAPKYMKVAPHEDDEVCNVLFWTEWGHPDYSITYTFYYDPNHPDDPCKANNVSCVVDAKDVVSYEDNGHCMGSTITKIKVHSGSIYRSVKGEPVTVKGK